jgi:hypothetical protein
MDRKTKCFKHVHSYITHGASLKEMTNYSDPLKPHGIHSNTT